MPISSSNFAKALWPGVNKWYGDAYATHSTEYTSLFSTSSSRKAFEEDVSQSMFGLAAVKPEGSAIAYDTAQQGFITRYQHVSYGLGFVITSEMVEDDLYDVIGKKRATALAFSMNQTKEIVAANVYNRAETAGYTGGDGSTMLSTTHANTAGGTYSNRLTTAADLSEASLEQALIDIGKLENDRGLKIAIMPQSLIIPVDLQFEADRILNSTLRPGTADNDKAVLNGKFPGGVVMNHYLTDTNNWFIRTNCPDGMKHFERRGDAFSMDNDFDTDNAKYKATGRYSFGWTDPRGIFGSSPA